MPGLDGTGPIGFGPRTGGGFGACPPLPQDAGGLVYGLGRGGLPWGGGRGRGFGGGRAGRGWFGRRAMAWPGRGVPPGAPGPMSAQEEKVVLQNQIDELTKQLEACRARMSAIGAASSAPTSE
jgi:hypothetical protein